MNKNLSGCSLAKNKVIKAGKRSHAVLKGINNRKRNLMLLISPRKNKGIKLVVPKQVKVGLQRKKEVTGKSIVNNKKGTVVLPKLSAET